MIPGSNILNTALSVIARQQVEYYKFIRRVENEAGLDVNEYAYPMVISGSWQPVPRNLYQQLGLDFNKIYVTFYVSKQILDVQRNVAGDQLAFNGKRYQVLQANDWTEVDGWTGVLVVYIGEDGGPCA